MQLVSTFSKLTREAPKQCVKVNNKDTRMMSLTAVNVATNNNYVKITYSSFGWKRGQIAYSCNCPTIEAIKISFR